MNKIKTNDVYWMMGFIESPIELYENTKYEGPFGGPRDYGFYIYPMCGSIKQYGRNGKGLIKDCQIPLSFTFNDRFKLVLDFVKHTMSFYWNDTFAGIVYEGIPDVLCPAITCCHSNGVINLTTTKFGPCIDDK